MSILTDETANRAIQTTYTNTTGEDLFVMVTPSTTAGNEKSFQAMIGLGTANQNIASCVTSPSQTLFARCEIAFMVPAGYDYQVRANNVTNVTLFEWWEYRQDRQQEMASTTEQITNLNYLVVSFWGVSLLLAVFFFLAYYFKNR